MIEDASVERILCAHSPHRDPSSTTTTHSFLSPNIHNALPAPPCPLVPSLHLPHTLSHRHALMVLRASFEAGHKVVGRWDWGWDGCGWYGTGGNFIVGAGGVRGGVRWGLGDWLRGGCEFLLLSFAYGRGSYADTGEMVSVERATAPTMLA
jgi:hypothetical protein